MKSIIDERAKQISEAQIWTSNIEYKELQPSIQTKYKDLIELIPEDVYNSLKSLLEEYLLDLDKLQMVIEREVYKIGLRDGVELGNVLRGI